MCQLYNYIHVGGLARTAHLVNTAYGYIPMQTTTAIAELCVSGFGGTSSSCPMMAGAIALALEAKLDIYIMCVQCNEPGTVIYGLHTTIFLYCCMTVFSYTYTVLSWLGGMSCTWLCTHPIPMWQLEAHTLQMALELEWAVSLGLGFWMQRQWWLGPDTGPLFLPSWNTGECLLPLQG